MKVILAYIPIECRVFECVIGYHSLLPVDSTCNRNVGKYNLHHIWDRILFNTPDLKISNNNGHAHRIMGMHIEYPSVGILCPFQSLGICIEL